MTDINCITPIESDVLPKNFKYAITSSTDTEITIRCSLNSIQDINSWVLAFGKLTNTKWNSRKTYPCGRRMVCAKLFVCQHSSFMKVPSKQNKRGNSKNASCEAKIYVKIKLLTKNTKKRDSFVKDGLRAVIRISKCHSHSVNSFESLRFLQDGAMRDTFNEYFGRGMNASEARNYHQTVLLANDTTELDLANSRINPTARSISYWYDEWRKSKLGPRAASEFSQVWTEDVKFVCVRDIESSGTGYCASPISAKSEDNCDESE